MSSLKSALLGIEIEALSSIKDELDTNRSYHIKEEDILEVIQGLLEIAGKVGPRNKICFVCGGKVDELGKAKKKEIYEQ